MTAISKWSTTPLTRLRGRNQTWQRREQTTCMDINFHFGTHQQAELTMVTVMYQYGEQMVIKVEQAAPKAKENVVTISGLEMDR